MTFSLAFYLTPIWQIAGGVLVVLALAGEAGWRLGHARQGADDPLRTLVGGVAAATLGLLGLLLGFTLSMSISRFDARRVVVVDEANAIGTLWLRAGLLDESLRGDLRAALGDYVQARLDLSHVGADLDRLRAARERSAALQRTIWAVVERANRPATGPAVLSAVIAAANDLIDLDELRMASLENYIPAPIIFLLVGVAAIALAFFGWSFGAANRRSPLSMALLTLLVTSVLVVVMDLNRPHRGLIRVGDESLVRVGRAMQ